jgi:hypothetical protein
MFDLEATCRAEAPRFPGGGAVRRGGNPFRFGNRREAIGPNSKPVERHHTIFGRGDHGQSD